MSLKNLLSYFPQTLNSLVKLARAYVVIRIDPHLRTLGNFIDGVLVDVHAIELVQQLIFLCGILYPWQSELQQFVARNY